MYYPALSLKTFQAVDLEAVDWKNALSNQSLKLIRE
jgi:hypothetical protein